METFCDWAVLLEDSIFDINIQAALFCFVLYKTHLLNLLLCSSLLGAFSFSISSFKHGVPN